MKVYNIFFLQVMPVSNSREVLQPWLNESCGKGNWEWIGSGNFDGFYDGIRLFNAESATAFSLRWPKKELSYIINEVEYEDI